MALVCAANSIHGVGTAGSGTRSAAIPRIPIVVPGAKGSLGKIESSVRGAAAQCSRVRAEDVPLGRVPPAERATGTAEDGTDGHGSVEGREADHAAELLVRFAAGNVLEIPADVLVLLDLDVAAEEQRREHPLAQRGLRVDLLGDQLPEDEAALRVADEDDSATMVVLPQVGLPGAQHARCRRACACAGVTALGSLIPARVSCRYIGAKTRQYCE